MIKMQRNSMSQDRNDHIGNAREYRSKAADCAVHTTPSLSQGNEARRSEKAYAALADNEGWLAKNSEKLV
jgi:hypothetical protein